MKRLLIIILASLVLGLAGCGDETPTAPTDLASDGTSNEATDVQGTTTMAEIDRLVEMARASADKANVLPAALAVLGQGGIAYNRALSGDYMDETIFFATPEEIWFYQFWWQEYYLGDLRTHLFSDRLDDEPASWTEVPTDPQEIVDTIYRVFAALGDPDNKIILGQSLTGPGIIYLYYVVYLDENDVRREFVMAELRVRQF